MRPKKRRSSAKPQGKVSSKSRNAAHIKEASSTPSDGKAQTDADSPARQERYGSWYPVFTDEFDEEDADAMHHEFLLATDQRPGGETYSGIARYVGPYRGRDPEEVLLEMWGEAAEKLISRKWHPTEKVHVRSDRVLEYRVTIAPCRAMKRWVMGFAPNFRVMSPIGLRYLIIDDLEAILEKYERVGREYDEEKKRRERN